MRGAMHCAAHVNPFYYKGYPCFSTTDSGDFALQGHAVEQVVADVGADAGQFLFHLVFVDVGHNHLVEVCAQAG